MRPLIALLMSVSPAFADIEHARDLMETNQFEQAYTELAPAALAGNADAEELIGIMYAMGLGVERDEKKSANFPSAPIK